MPLFDALALDNGTKPHTQNLTSANIHLPFLYLSKALLHQTIGSQKLGLELLLSVLRMVVCVTYSFCLFIHLYQPQLLQNRGAEGAQSFCSAEPETKTLLPPSGAGRATLIRKM